MKKSQSVVVLFAALTLSSCKSEKPNCDNGSSWDGNDCFDGRDSTDTAGHHYRHSHFGYWYRPNMGGTITRYYRGRYTETVDAATHRSGTHLSGSSHLSHGGSAAPSSRGGFGSSVRSFFSSGS